MANGDAGSSGGPISLDQFIALNDELAALVRAGVPLERGLIEAGRDLRGRLGVVSTKLGERMGEGLRLPEAVAASGGGMPDVYRAVVEAGVRSGRLAEALEGMAGIARAYAEARRAVGMAMLYPLIVLGLAYGLALLFLAEIVPRFIAAFEGLGVAQTRSLGLLGKLGEVPAYWAAIPPILILLAISRWAWAGRSVVLETGGLGPYLGPVPLVGPMIASFRMANFAALLALLIEHRVPLDEAVRLAGDASGDRKLRASAARFAGSIRSGEPAKVGGSKARGDFPPLLSWMLGAGHRQGDLPRALGHLATTYRRQARSRADFLRLALPSLCLLVIGVGAVLVYAMLLFIPLTSLLDGLASPVNR